MSGILVLDGNQRSALAITRSLGSQKFTIFTADTAKDHLAAASKYCHQALSYPDPNEDIGKFIDTLVGWIEQYQFTMCIPATDITTAILVAHQETLGKIVRLALPDPDAYENLTDKYKLIKIAKPLGIHCPKSELIRPGKTVNIASIESWPVVLKPCRSKIQIGNKWLGTSVKIAHSAKELESFIETYTWFKKYDWLLQEYIEGQGRGIFSIYNRGRPVAFFAHQRLREKPPWGGVSVLSESISPDAAALDASRDLLDKCNWHGVAMVEFKYGADGKAYLMEVNTRFWGSLQLAIDCGVDFPNLLEKISREKMTSKIKNYKTGQRLRWLLGDVDHLYLIFKTTKLYSWNDRMKAVFAFLSPNNWKSRSEIFRWHDPKPAWRELKHYFLK